MVTLHKDALVLVIAGAIYGAAIGAAHSVTLAVLNLLKLPLLLTTTAIVCAIAYFLCARLWGLGIDFVHVLGLVVRCFRDIALLLASVAPACLFFARAFDPATSLSNRGEYPWFVGLNVALIALCGTLAVIRQGRTLLVQHGLSAQRSATLVTAWLALSLVVGAQGAWYLRPFFGRRFMPVTTFCRGAEADEYGATSFYTAVYHLVRLPER
jgi:hypothetical protein